MTLSEAAPRSAATGPAFATAPTGIYAIVVAAFCGVLLISNVAATKTITVVDGLPAFLGGGIFTDGGALLFPLTYIIGDVLAEVYGLRQARRAIWVGFALAALASVTFLAVGAAPPGPGYENQAAFQAVLGFVPRIVLASLCGYLAGQFLNAYVVVKIKERTQERRLWVRLIGSTVVGEFADTALFCFIAFVGVFPTWGSLISFTVTGYVYKVLVEVIFLPITYAVIAAIKKREPGYAAHTARLAGRQAAAAGRGDRGLRPRRRLLSRPARARAGGHLHLRRRRAGDDPGRRPGHPRAVQPRADRADRSGRGRTDRGQREVPGRVRDRRRRRRDRTPGRGGSRTHRPTDPDAVELPQRAAERARRAAADDLHRTGRPAESGPPPVGGLSGPRSTGRGSRS